MIAAVIAAALGGAHRSGQWWRCRCPVHSSRGSTLALREGDRGLVLCCHAGCSRDQILAELRRRGLIAIRAAEPPLSAPIRNDSSNDDFARRIAIAGRIWGGARDARGTPVERYLVSRGITVPPPAALRWAPALSRPDGTQAPVMIARVDNVDGELIGVHRTYLTPDWQRRDRASFGPIAGSAVRLGNVRSDTWLGIGEGIETTLSVMLATGLPGWAALSAVGIEQLILPPEARMVLIVADHDANGIGERAARAAAERWLAEGRHVRPCHHTPAPTSTICCLAVLVPALRRRAMSPPDGAGAERVLSIVNAAEEVTPEPPRPLAREIPPADPFPVDALGSILAPAALAIHDRVQAPIAICAQSVFGAATLAAQGYADVVLPIGPGQNKPLSNYFITVAETGERKSACDAEAMRPIRMHETALRAIYNLDLANYANAKAAFDAARQAAIKSGKGSRAAIKVALDAIGPGPIEPLLPLLTCPEPTYEGLCRVLAHGQPSIGVFAAEGGQFVGGHGMSDEARLRTAAGLSAAWDGETIRRVRATSDITNLHGRRVAMHLMVQPFVASILLRDPLLAGQGFLSRLLISGPDSAMGTRMSHDEAPETVRDLDLYDARLLYILNTPFPLAQGQNNELQPRPLPLSPTAQSIWLGFADHIEREITPGGGLELAKGLANKLPEHAARMAAVLSLMQDIYAGDIADTEMAAGIELAQHYATEALRLHGFSCVGEGLRRAQELLDWLLLRWKEPVVSLPDIYQRGPNSIRDANTAKSAVSILDEHGWLAKIPQGATVARVRRKDAWRIVRG